MPTKPVAPSAANQGSSNWHEKADAGTAHYQLAMGQTASGGSPFQRVDATYPPSLLARCPEPVNIDAQVIVDTDGKASEVRMAGEAQADEEHRLFMRAVRDAIKQWEFNPLVIRYWTADAKGEQHYANSETKPFSLNYTFHFECRDGHAVTRAEDRKAGG
jgi:hypothetical protein